MTKRMHSTARRSSLVFAAIAGLAGAALALALTSHDGAGAAITPDDPRYSTQWSLPKIRANEAWAVTQGSGSVRVALLDTGVGYSSVPLDLQGNVGAAYDAFTGGSTTSDDYGTYGSGTSNAGVIGARTNNTRDVAGVNWNVTILPVKVCNWSGSCPHATIAAGIDWAIAQNAQIIQITPAQATTSSVLNEAVARAIAAGRIVVAPVAEPSIGAGYPASLPGVIGVGATTDTDALASFSAASTHVDISAPGQSIVALVSGGCCMTRSMTGLAASHVTGSLALLLGAGIPASAAPQHLYDGAADLGAPGWDAGYGWGRLDVCAALDDAGRACTGAAPTATPTHTSTPVPPTATNTAVPATATPTRTNTPAPATATNTPVPATATPTRTNTPVPPTATPTRTNTPLQPTATPTRTNTPQPATSTPTRTPTNTPDPTPSCVRKGKGKPRC